MKFFILMACLALTACLEKEVKIKPPPLALNEDSLGYYCQMHLLEHEGPKGQVHLEGYPAPIWFSQVRDGIAHIKSEERIADIDVFYVNDMGVASNWAKPGANNWVDAETAYFVVDSDAIGGMGAPEIVPFALKDHAQAYARNRGGSVKRLHEIKQEDVLAPVEISAIEGADK